jgi:hypothetical protein
MPPIEPRLEYRACAQDEGASPDYSDWTVARSQARAAKRAFEDEPHPPYDRIWLEKRHVGPPQDWDGS